MENSLENLKVLLVEDQPLNQFLAITILHQWKVLVEVASNGQIAVDKLSKGHYDLILMDIHMPVMDGLSATSIIRQELNIKTPIIALTADSTKIGEEKCNAIGMNAYVNKPFKPDILYNKIYNLVYRYN
ncbi:response regulator [Solitalea sp. MAHUQ-68]|uniref:Response regulator n=1 Tax=Solitalea agri TaxID=2953739 RepID=A0A9X2F3Q0_9SPHI|nr:response regulator [Solitalea agri]MCO4293600.1 response regulator [Solitalea agri]